LSRGAGRVLLFAHTRRGDSSELDLSAVCLDEKDLIGSYSSDFTLQNEVAELVFTRRFDVRELITHQFPLEQTEDAIRLAARPAAGSLKIVIVQEVGETAK
jgi:L-iditol 2-dehydrogenase